jgi:hypothetical protein
MTSRDPGRCGDPGVAGLSPSCRGGTRASPLRVAVVDLAVESSEAPLRSGRGARAGLNDAEREGADGALWVYVCAEAHGCSGVVRQLLWWGRRYFWDNFPRNQRANRTPNTA